MNESDLLSQDKFSSVVLSFSHIEQTAYASNMSFGARLKAKRENKGLTQEALGRGLSTGEADASKSVVYGWEKDQHFPRVDQLALICKKLDCSADYLMFGSGPTFTAGAMRIAEWFDRLEDPKDRALAETRATQVIVNILLKHDLPPTHTPGPGVAQETPPAPSHSPAPPSQTKPARSKTR